MSSDDFSLAVRVAPAQHSQRLDQFLAAQLPECSRVQIQNAIRQGLILKNGAPAKPSSKVQCGEEITGVMPAPEDLPDAPEAIPLHCLYVDEDLIVLDKPAGLVTHPAPGNREGTLLNALLHHFPENAKLPRAGIVHRLDKDTSGVMVVAHNARAREHLIAQLECRSMGRTYLALVHPAVTAGGTIDAPIGRHPQERVKMAVREGGKPARTHYRIEAQHPAFSLLRVQLESGRTHQIRVHLSAQGHPLVGDVLYGGVRSVAGLDETTRAVVQNFPRQALHAWQLHLLHPRDGALRNFTAPLPPDFRALLEALGLRG